MAQFLELTVYDGKKVLLNIEHILKVCPDEIGCYVFFVVVSGTNGSTSIERIHVKESYATLKRKLGI